MTTTEKALKFIATTVEEEPSYYLSQFKDPGLAIFSYYLESEKQALIIDPTFNIAKYQELLETRQATLKYVALTHYHADFVAGHTQFQVPVVLGPTDTEEITAFQLESLENGSSVKLGKIELKLLHTPGHTLESSCFILLDENKVQKKLFTGDTIFIGEVGRPDLAVLGKHTVEDLAGMLFDSLQTIKKLNKDIRIYPAHGSGSACGKTIGQGNFTTLQEQLKTNYALKMTEKDQFIKKCATGLAKPPGYFQHDVRLNKEGPGPYAQVFQKTFVGLTLEQFKNEQQKGVTVIDLRDEPTDGLIKDSYWLPSKGQVCSWLSMVVKPEEPIILFCDEENRREATDRLLRIGFFNLKGHNLFKMSEWPAEKMHPKIIYSGVQSLEVADRTHLDVRNIPEFIQTGVIQDSILIPLPELVQRTQELQEKSTIFLSCRSGMRARFAYTILARKGIESIIVSDLFVEFKKEGLPVVDYVSCK